MVEYGTIDGFVKKGTNKSRGEALEFEPILLRQIFLPLGGRMVGA